MIKLCLLVPRARKNTHKLVLFLGLFYEYELLVIAHLT
jgi:hypothetical protein